MILYAWRIFLSDGSDPHLQIHPQIGRSCFRKVKSYLRKKGGKGTYSLKLSGLSTGKEATVENDVAHITIKSLVKCIFG